MRNRPPCPAVPNPMPSAAPSNRRAACRRTPTRRNDSSTWSQDHFTLERGRSLDFPFETIAGAFRLIETAMVPVIVPWCGADGLDDTAERLLKALRWVQRPGRIARQLQPYAVQVPPRIRTDLLNAGAAEAVRRADFDHQFVVLSKSGSVPVRNRPHPGRARDPQGRGIVVLNRCFGYVCSLMTIKHTLCE